MSALHIALSIALYVGIIHSTTIVLQPNVTLYDFGTIICWVGLLDLVKTHVMGSLLSIKCLHKYGVIRLFYMVLFLVQCSITSVWAE